MKREDILTRVCELFAECAELEAEEVSTESELVNDLGLSSVEILSVVSELEEAFSARIPERALRGFVSVGDVADFIAEL